MNITGNITAGRDITIEEHEILQGAGLPTEQQVEMQALLAEFHQILEQSAHEKPEPGRLEQVISKMGSISLDVCSKLVTAWAIAKL